MTSESGTVLTMDPVKTLLATWGRNVKARRTEAGLNQRTLAEKAEVSQSAVSLLERGLWEPSLAIRIRLAKALEAPADSVFPHTAP
jgi:transcriptional regulator with XRE-family HTH domain